jgi:hypothetical protein
MPRATARGSHAPSIQRRSDASHVPTAGLLYPCGGFRLPQGAFVTSLPELAEVVRHRV